jgi:hypothetical protein
MLTNFGRLVIVAGLVPVALAVDGACPPDSCTHYIAADVCGGVRSEMCMEPGMTAAVRCCDKPPNPPKSDGNGPQSICTYEAALENGNPQSWTKAKDPITPCHRGDNATWQMAYDECDARNQRLCSKDELKFVCPTGCGYGTVKVWTSDACDDSCSPSPPPSPPPAPPAPTLCTEPSDDPENPCYDSTYCDPLDPNCGAAQAPAPPPQCPPPPPCAPKHIAADVCGGDQSRMCAMPEMTAAVRCCDLPPRPPKSDGFGPHSICTIEAATENGNPGSWTEAKDPITPCHRGDDATWEEANAECLARGQRLCSKDELKAVCPTGCGYASVEVWTRESCGPSCGEPSPPPSPPPAPPAPVTCTDGPSLDPEDPCYDSTCDPNKPIICCTEPLNPICGSAAAPAPPPPNKCAIYSPLKHVAADVCGGVQSEMCMEPMTVAAVRCCDLPPNPPKSDGNGPQSICTFQAALDNGNPRSWTEAKDPITPCHRGDNATWQMAFDECTTRGQRLCNKDELKFVCPTGCGYGTVKVWTADECA